MKTLDAKQAAEFLQLHYNTIILLAQKGKIPCRKVGGKWRFMESALADWITGNYNDSSPAPKQELKIITGGNQWRSTKEEKSGGSISKRQTDDTYNSLLKLKTSSKPKNSTTV